jgi:DNA polymerase III epsilon subunit-like protein
MTDWTNLEYVVVDVEGNGQQPPDLVELAVVRITGGAIGELKSWLVRPLTPITPFAQRLHGISNQQVADLPAFEDIKDEVRQALAADALVAHNAHVDVGVLARKLDGWHSPEVFDTLKLARRLRPHQMSYKLGSLVAAYRLAEAMPEDLGPHRATYDALCAARLFIHLATNHGRPLPLEALRDHPAQGGGDEAPALF